MAIGGVDPAGQDMTLHVGQKLAFTPIDVLAAVQPPVFKDARGEPHALAIETD